MDKVEKEEYTTSAKIWTFLYSVCNPIFAYVMFYAFYNTDREVAKRFKQGGSVGIILWVIGIIAGFVLSLM